MISFPSFQTICEEKEMTLFHWIPKTTEVTFLDQEIRLELNLSFISKPIFTNFKSFSTKVMQLSRREDFYQCIDKPLPFFGGSATMIY